MVDEVGRAEHVGRAAPATVPGTGTAEDARTGPSAVAQATPADLAPALRGEHEGRRSSARAPLARQRRAFRAGHSPIGSGRGATPPSGA